MSGGLPSSRRSSFAEDAEHAAETFLQEGDTTIMLRSLPAVTTTASLMSVLGPSFIGRYDFLYLPRCSRHPHRIVEMAFINFVDHQDALRAVQVFQHVTAEEPSWSRTRISQARIQGLGPNLAYFILRFGETAVSAPDAPLVLDKGLLADLSEACRRHVNDQAKQVAREVLRREGGEHETLRGRTYQREPSISPFYPVFMEHWTINDTDELLRRVHLHELWFGSVIFRL